MSGGLSGGGGGLSGLPVRDLMSAGSQVLPNSAQLTSLVWFLLDTIVDIADKLRLSKASQPLDYVILVLCRRKDDSLELLPHQR